MFKTNKSDRFLINHVAVVVFKWTTQVLNILKHLIA